MGGASVAVNPSSGGVLSVAVGAAAKMTKRRNQCALFTFGSNPHLFSLPTARK